MKAEHIIVSFLIFTMLSSLMLTAYNGMVESYEFTPTTDAQGKTIMDRLNEIAIIDAVNTIIDSWTKMTNPTNSVFDRVGGFLGVGIGALFAILGIIAFPVQILGVIAGYHIPAVVATILPMIVTIYVYAILIKKQTGGGE